MKSKNLIIIFIVLLLVYGGITLFGDKKDRSFDDNIVDFKIDNVDKLVITPKEKNKEKFELKKSNNEWKISTETDEYLAEKSIVDNVLSSLSKMKVKNIVTKNPEKFSKYELENDNCKRVEVYSGSDKLSDVMIGKFKYDPQTRMASSYVRLSGKDEVYSTDGFSGINISDNVNTYRIKTIADFDPANLKSIKLNKSGINREIVKQGDEWVVDNIVLDSTKMKSFISTMSKMKGSKFIDNSSEIQNLENPEQLNLVMVDKSINIEAYPDTLISKGFIIHSSENPKAYFDSDSAGIYKRIFGTIDDLLKEVGK